jgi:hypothetical protein
MKHIVCGGRGKGKMYSCEKFLELLPEDMRKKVIVIKASDSVPELRGNQLPKLRLLPIELYDNKRKD